MVPIKFVKRSVGVLGAAAMALSLAACGSDDSDHASKAAFCKAYLADEKAVDAVAPKDFAGLADAAHHEAVDLKELGTPEGIPADAQEGFHLNFDAIEKLDAADFAKAARMQDEDALDRIAGLSAADQKKTAAFWRYADDTCGAAAQ